MLRRNYIEEVYVVSCMVVPVTLLATPGKWSKKVISSLGDNDQLVVGRD